uniref:Glycosyltransferase n=1 Tax=Kalanchoe fedtschenkoi TaxID=63787 RepID=A0A7N0TRZ1_KALFE
MGSKGRSRRHIVMAPFMAQGHLIPFLALANHIHKRTAFTITIATTPLNLKYLRRALSRDMDRAINLAELPFSSSHHGLPPDTENTEALTLSQVAVLGMASTSLKAPFHELVKKIAREDGAPPLCIISDVFLGWANEVAKLCDTVNITFTTGGAYGTAAYATVWQNLPHRKLKPGEEEFSLPGFPDSVKVHVSQLHQFIREADGTDVWSRFFQSQLKLSGESHGWLCNTAEEVEKCGLEVLRNYLKLPVWPIGPLLPESMLKPQSGTTRPMGLATQRAGKEYGISPSRCVNWLDSKPERSVVFISFGSQNSIKQSQMLAIAAGLEQSGRSFIWVIRPPVEFDRNVEFRPEWLPDGFEERVASQGLLVRQWAPQLEILAHKSTGAFLSHCGWNSLMEGLSQGVPIIGWPLAAEQSYNSKMLVEEMRVAVEICRGLDGVLTAEKVTGVVEMVLGEEGRSIRVNAEEIGVKMKAAMRDEEGFEGSSIKALDEFVAYVTSRAEP